jgi:uncharacterized protein (DUF1684 family)
MKIINKKWDWSGFVAMTLAVVTGLAQTASAVTEQKPVQLQEWREKMDQRLRSPYGWLAMVGLHWLDRAEISKDGILLSGEKKVNGISLPESCQQTFRLRIAGKAPEARITLELLQQVPPKNSAVTPSGSEQVQFLPRGDESKITKFAAGQSVELSTDQVRGSKVDRVRCGDSEFQVLWRNQKFALRVADARAPSRLKFSGRQWFPENKELTVSAKWIPDAVPLKVKISDVLGGSSEETSPGVAEFKVGSETVRLRPILEDDQYFFIFKDQTSRDRTYSAGRFLYSPKEKDGVVELDFNRAYNPPCAFNKFTTCPLPMKQNILRVKIEAGELKPNNI